MLFRSEIGLELYHRFWAGSLGLLVLLEPGLYLGGDLLCLPDFPFCTRIYSHLRFIVFTRDHLSPRAGRYSLHCILDLPPPATRKWNGIQGTDSVHEAARRRLGVLDTGHGHRLLAH